MNRTLLFLCLLLLFTACGTDSTTDTPPEAPGDGLNGPFAELSTDLEGDNPDAPAIAARLRQLFPSVSDAQTGALDVDVSRQYVALAEAFADKFPADTVAAPPLYNAAEVALALGQPQRAADIYARLYHQYRTFSKAPEALFMLAFTHDENLKDTASARTYYRQFIDTYPTHTFADDSEMLIRNLGKSDAELLRELEGS